MYNAQRGGVMHPGLLKRRRLALGAGFAAALAALPVMPARAQYYAPYYAPCAPNPLLWPVCVAGAVVGTAAALVTAPFWLVTGPPPPSWYGFWGPPYPVPPYYGPRYYPPPPAPPPATPH